MELDSQLLHDLCEFLRTLEDARLPAMLEALRNKLLDRVKSALATDSNYIDMQGGKLPKDHQSTAETCSEDYVIPDQQISPKQSFLYTHQNRKSDSLTPKFTVPTYSIRPAIYVDLAQENSPYNSSPSQILDASNTTELVGNFQDEDPLRKVYTNMSLIEARKRSQHYGELRRRWDGKRWDGKIWKRVIIGMRQTFGKLQSFTAVLIGSHLLTYDIKMEMEPYDILWIKGCTCKPVGNHRRNVKKQTDFTFELCYDNNNSYQFIASTSKEMAQWIVAITHCQESETNEPDIMYIPLRGPSKPAAPIPEADKSSDGTNWSEEYIEFEDPILDNAGALAIPMKTPERPITPKPTPSKSNNSSKMLKLESPQRSILINRDLPPTPLAAETSEHEQDMYDTIADDHSSGKIGYKELQTPVKSQGGVIEEFYDDIETVKKDVQHLKDGMSGEVQKRNIPAEDDAQTYDDVIVAKTEIQQARRNEKTSPLNQVGKLKKSPGAKEPPMVPTKSSQAQSIGEIFGLKNKSPIKEAVKKKPIISPREKLIETATPKKQSTDQQPSETGVDGSSNNQMLEDISEYNSPPSPRPVQGDLSSSNDMDYEEGEAIYDDIVNKKDVSSNNLNVSTKIHSGKLEKDEKMVTKLKLQPEPSEKSQRNVVRNLNKAFEDEIENQPGNDNLEDNLEHYQVPKANADSESKEEIYDDVVIVTQKKRQIESAKQKSSVVNSSPEFNRSPTVMAKPLSNKPFHKLNKLLSSVTEKSYPENNIQHQFKAGKN